MTKIIYFAPANSVHSYRWIYYLKKNYKLKLLWITFHEVEKKFSHEYPGFEFIVLRKEHNLINSKNPFKKILGLYRSKKIINKIFFSSNYEFIHVQSFGKYGVVSSLLNNQIKYIGTAWGSDIIFSGYGIRYFLLKKALLRAKYVTCDAIHMVERLKKINKNINVELINFGVEMNLYKIKKIKTNVFTILSLRNHFPIYDIETLIEAFSVFSNDKNVNLIIAGYGDLTKSYQRMVEDRSIKNKVNFYGKYNRESLLKILKETNLYISSSKSDAGIAASTAEVMACKIPVLISDSGENKMWIEDSINGFIFKTSNVKNLIQKLNLVYNLSQKRINKISKKGYDTIYEKNNLDIEMKKLFKLYSNINK